MPADKEWKDNVRLWEEDFRNKHASVLLEQPFNLKFFKQNQKVSKYSTYRYLFWANCFHVLLKKMDNTQTSKANNRNHTELFHPDMTVNI